MRTEDALRIQRRLELAVQGQHAGIELHDRVCRQRRRGSEWRGRPPGGRRRIPSRLLRRVAIHRRLPFHSITWLPGRRSGGVVDLIDRRHSVPPRKPSSRCSRTDSQNASASGTGSPPSLRRPAATPSELPDRRTLSAPSAKHVAEIGSGCPAQWFIASIACASSIWNRSVTSSSGRGSTFKEASRITPSVPNEPVSSRERSKPATFFMTWPPKLSTSPLASSTLTPSTKSRTEPAAARRGPEKPAATHPPRVASDPKRGGSQASI